MRRAGREGEGRHVGSHGVGWVTIGADFDRLGAQLKIKRCPTDDFSGNRDTLI